MKIYTDENMESAIISGLRRRSIDVITSLELGYLGKSDEFHFEQASKRNAIILTHDTDFLKMAANREHKGMIYAHPQRVSISECIRKVEMLVNVLTLDDMKNHVEFL